MKYIKKIPQTDKEMSDKFLSEGWIKLKEPSNLGLSILLSFPFMIMNGAISLLISYYLYSPLREMLNITRDFNFTFNINLSSLLYLLGIFAFMMMHEFLHALFIPGIFKSKEIFWGINGAFAFVYTTEKIKKGRFILISLMPFFLLSIVLPFILNTCGWLSGYAIFLFLINAMGSCVDCLNICFIVAQMPKNSYIVNNGLESYYK